MLAIKLSRVGKKNQPSYRILVLEKSKDPWGDYLENVGFYNPKAQPKMIDLKVERIKHWLSKGAQPTPTVHNLLISQGVIEGKKLGVTRITKQRAEKIATKKIEAEQKAEATKAEAAKHAEPAPAEAQPTPTEPEPTPTAAEPKPEPTPDAPLA